MAFGSGLPVALLLIALGLRVWRQAVKGGGLPDRMVGLFFVCLGLGATPALQANDPSLFPGQGARVAMAVGHGLLSLGFGALFVFAWRCFGPASAWRRALALSGCGGLAGLYLAQGWVEGFAAPGGAVVRVTALLRAAALLWAFGESLGYRGRMKRRVAVGLADPIVANRFLLWCGWTGGLLGALSVVIAVRFLLPDFGPETPGLVRAMVTAAVLGFATLAGLSLWLAFFPPAAYAARLRAGAGS